jgi:hypothetical protein
MHFRLVYSNALLISMSLGGNYPELNAGNKDQTKSGANQRVRYFKTAVGLYATARNLITVKVVFKHVHSKAFIHSLQKAAFELCTEF